MKIFLKRSFPPISPLFLVAIFFALFFAVQAQAQKARSLKVMAYNIHHANPPSKPDFIDIEAIAKVILDADPDLVALQEVDVNTKRSGVDLNQAKELAMLTGMNYYFEPSIPYQGGGYGNAILSKFPIEKKAFYPLSAEEGTEPRAVLTIQVTLPGKRKVKFASTHLDFSVSSNTTQQAKDVIEYYKKEKLPVIIAGDFNAIADSDAIKTMDSGFERTCTGSCPPTIPVINPKRAIDFIYFKSKQPFKVKHHEVISETYASDHLPVFAILTY
ncbi:endonuclease/exonuclease/phosphatase family protein [Cyclobacterium qasimii]|uniref:Endonuclease n=2 Tax=Cyclobacterium qasimii TaxID=1350429 RepID=A0A512CDI7_9BACT|nr:endonuclease/exonuclease/phosphatase family protein [Cyclobacterium qasimii]EPR70549.1 putative secreted protein [Cyclobacterium qasimii M12-11B]GEO22271.1 endonuclease [Cyclobacterium qasimii]